MEYQKRKLSQYHADKIREMNIAGVGTKKLAEQFGVSRAAVKLIIKNKTYKNGESEVRQSSGGLF